MEKHGLKVLGYKPMWYDSFYISLLSSKYQHTRQQPRNFGAQGKSNWLAAAWNGFRSNVAAIGDKKKCSSIIYVIAK
jgi:hypothetical protein